MRVQVRLRVRGKREERHGRTTRRSTRASSSSIPRAGWGGWGRSAAASEPPARRRPPRTRRPARAVLDPHARAGEGGPPSVAAHARGTTSVTAREGATSSPCARARPRLIEWAGASGLGRVGRGMQLVIARAPSLGAAAARTERGDHGRATRVQDRYPGWTERRGRGRGGVRTRSSTLPTWTMDEDPHPHGTRTRTRTHRHNGPRRRTSRPRQRVGPCRDRALGRSFWLVLFLRSLLGRRLARPRLLLRPYPARVPANEINRQRSPPPPHPPPPSASPSHSLANEQDKEAELVITPETDEAHMTPYPHIKEKPNRTSAAYAFSAQRALHVCRGGRGAECVLLIFFSLRREGDRG